MGDIRARHYRVKKRERESEARQRRRERGRMCDVVQRAPTDSQQCLKPRDTEVNILQPGSILCAEKLSLSLQTRVSVLFSFIYLSSSSLIFVESCPKQLYGATRQIYGSQNVHRERLVPSGKWEMREREREMGSSGGYSGWAVKSEL